jgi:hypothetical protein
MRRICFIVCFCMIVFGLGAQTVEEWTQQQQTAIKRLVEQIIANKVLIGHVQNGIKIVSGGLHAIRDIKDGDFNLHLGYFDSFKNVNPKIKTSVKVAEIVSLQLRMVKILKESLISAKLSGQLTVQEIGYCSNVIDAFLKGCLQAVDELMLVISSAELAMTDDERLQRISRIYLLMLDRFEFACSFGNELKLLSTQRSSEQIELNYTKK